MLRRQRDGVYRSVWYGEYKDELGRRKVLALKTKVAGTPPTESRGAGCKDFEDSRKSAIDELKGWQEDARRKGRAAHLVERLIEAKTGRTVQYARIDALPQLWRDMGRELPASEAHLANCDAHFRRFTGFMERHSPKTTCLYQVTPEDATSFVAELRDHLAPATAAYGVRLLAKAFSRFLPVGAENPFSGLTGRRTANAQNSVIHRKPFSAEELRSLLDAARSDAFMYPLVVTAVCTGMRRGDVCRLRWSSVDLKSGMLDVKTSKTGAGVEIPIFEPLRAVLESRPRARSDDPVFPEAAKLLEEYPDALTRKFKAIVARVFDPGVPEPVAEPVPADEIASEGAEAIILNMPAGNRRNRMLDVLGRYCGGESVRQIEKAVGCTRSTVSADLRAVESWVGKPFVRRTPGRQTHFSMTTAIARVTRSARPQGQKAASVRDWHSLRATWVTLALSAGVPMELVRRVTGHATVDVVLRHYFRPGREEFKAALAGALPSVLTGVPVDSGQLTVGSEQRAGHVPGGKGASKDAKRENDAALSPADELAGLVAKLADGSASEADRARFRELAAGV